jgi:hypothetical protein
MKQVSAAISTAAKDASAVLRKGDNSAPAKAVKFACLLAEDISNILVSGKADTRQSDTRQATAKWCTLVWGFLLSRALPLIPTAADIDVTDDMTPAERAVRPLLDELENRQGHLDTLQDVYSLKERRIGTLNATMKTIKFIDDLDVSDVPNLAVVTSQVVGAMQALVRDSVQTEDPVERAALGARVVYAGVEAIALMAAVIAVHGESADSVAAVADRAPDNKTAVVGKMALLKKSWVGVKFGGTKIYEGIAWLCVSILGPIFRFLRKVCVLGSAFWESWVGFKLGPRHFLGGLGFFLFLLLVSYEDQLGNDVREGFVYKAEVKTATGRQPVAHVGKRSSLVLDGLNTLYGEGAALRLIQWLQLTSGKYISPHMQEEFRRQGRAVMTAVRRRIEAADQLVGAWDDIMETFTYMTESRQGMQGLWTRAMIGGAVGGTAMGVKGGFALGAIPGMIGGSIGGGVVGAGMGVYTHLPDADENHERAITRQIVESLVAAQDNARQQMRAFIMLALDVSSEVARDMEAEVRMAALRQGTLAGATDVEPHYGGIMNFWNAAMRIVPLQKPPRDRANTSIYMRLLQGLFGRPSSVIREVPDLSDFIIQSDYEEINVQRHYEALKKEFGPRYEAERRQYEWVQQLFWGKLAVIAGMSFLGVFAMGAYLQSVQEAKEKAEKEKKERAHL